MAVNATIQHFSHPHQLVEICASTKYTCDGCKTPGNGPRYRCSPCDFDLHKYCGSCPERLSSFMHPHPLSLTHAEQRICDVCRDPLNGFFYNCRDCGFDVHPLCTLLPEELNHALHQAHPLRLESAPPGSCAVCCGSCTSWRYRCKVCCFDIHIACVLEPSAPPTADRGFQAKERQAPKYSGNPGFGVSGPTLPSHPPNPWLHHGYWMPSQPFPFHHPPPAWLHGAQFYGVPYAPSSLSNNNANQSHGNGSLTGKLGEMMFSIVGTLTLGVLSSEIFGSSAPN